MNDMEVSAVVTLGLGIFLLFFAKFIYRFSEDCEELHEHIKPFIYLVLIGAIYCLISFPIYLHKGELERKGNENDQITLDYTE